MSLTQRPIIKTAGHEFIAKNTRRSAPFPREPRRQSRQMPPIKSLPARMTVPRGILDGMCRSIEEGGRRCSRVGCRSAAELTERRRKAAARQRRYAAKKRAKAEPGAGTGNPFARFTPEAAPLTAEQRDAERAKLEDFFARKLADPNARWDAAPKTVDAENPFKDWVTGQPIPER